MPGSAAGAAARLPMWPLKRGRGRPPGRLPVATCLTALLVSACATVPDSGAVQPGLAAAGHPEHYLQLIPAPPRPGLGAGQIVAGFLTASASFTNDHAVARQYLTPGAARSWHPGWAVTVVGSQVGSQQPAQPYRQTGQAELNVQVRPTGQKLAFLTDNGQYVGVQPNLNSAYTLNVKHTAQGWRISNPPPYLMITEPDFQRVYQPRNLYFLADIGHALVPYPVFVPPQATSVDLATKLVTALLHDPQGWLAGAAQTAVPAGSRQLGPVTINGGIATVDLGGAAAAAGKAAWRQMAAQLAWTLAGPSSGQPAIQSVQLEINGHWQASDNWSGGQPPQAGHGQPGVPEPKAGTPAYSAGSDGTVQVLAGNGSVSRSVSGPAADGTGPLAAVAVSPDGHYAAGLTQSGRVYFGAIGRGARLAPWGHGGGYTSVSWDNQNDLWVAGPLGVWRQPGAGGLAVSVLNVPDGYRVRQFIVAPDEVRVAMIVVPSGGGPAQLRLGAIGRTGNQVVLEALTVAIGSNVPSPTDLTWYDADNLIVLSGSQLWQVPVNGGAATTINTYLGTLSISAAGPANQLLAGLPHGQLATTSYINGSWTTVKGAGQDPTYPG